MNEKYPLALPEGTVLAGQYIIEKVLGQGGFGITYEAKDHKTDERVAVKEFFPDAMATRTNQTTVQAFSGERGESYEYGKECFLQEAETLAQFIGNENIVRIHSYFEENGTAYFVMDFVEGTSFDEYLKEHGGKVSFEEAAKVLIPVMDALSAVHAKGIVHRDVTPDNIYITKEGVVKLLDFGAARYSLGDKSRSLDVVLKHGFAPKEQYARRGKQGPFTDVYALGATFYFALTGKRPPDSIERMDEDDLVPPSTLGVQISKAAEDAILQALRVQPADRFQGMTAFKNAMAYSAGGNNRQTSGTAPVTQQRFFTAPNPPAMDNSILGQTVGASHTMSNSAQASASMGTPDSGQAPARGNSSAQAGGTAEGKKKPGVKKILLAVGIPLAVVLILAIVIFVRKGDAAEKSWLPAMAGAEDAEPGKYAILGNNAGNLMNMGYCATWDGVDYYFSDDCSTLYASSKGKSEEILSRGTDSFYQLSAVDGKLYYLCEDYAYTYDLAHEKEEEISVLEDYGGNIWRLYVTKKYFVIWCKDGVVYRVSRTGGTSEKCCTASYGNEFTLSEEGWIYYVTRSEEGYPFIKRMSLDTLEVQDEGINFTDPNYVFANPVVVDDDLYVLCFDTTGNGGRSIYRFSGDLDIERKGYMEWKIEGADLRKMDADGYNYAFNINMENHEIYFCETALIDGSISDSNLYRLKMNERGNFDEFTLIAEGGYRPHILYYADKGIDLLYQQRETRRGEWKMQVLRFDAEGNKIDD